MEDKIILKFKAKNILNFYEIEPWYHFWCIHCLHDERGIYNWNEME